jgi:hypothetical protein
VTTSQPNQEAPSHQAGGFLVAWAGPTEGTTSMTCDHQGKPCSPVPGDCLCSCLACSVRRQPQLVHQAPDHFEVIVDLGDGPEHLGRKKGTCERCGNASPDGYVNLWGGEVWLAYGPACRCAFTYRPPKGPAEIR